MTKDERRSASANLRHYAHDHLVGGVLGTLKLSMGMTAGTWRDVLLRLAELMDPDREGDRAERPVDRGALATLVTDMNEMFRIGAATGEGLDARWCRELYDQYDALIRGALGKERDGDR